MLSRRIFGCAPSPVSQGMSSPRRFRRSAPTVRAALLLVAIAFLAAPGKASADFLYASDLDHGQIYKVDKSTGTLLQTIPVSEPLDSLIFDSQGDIIYSAYSVGGVGQLRMVNPTVGISSDTLLATVGNLAVDLALVPGGNSVLVTSQATGKIYEVNLANPSQPPLTFGSGQYTGGIVYDNAGRLFAVSGSRIVELNPQTFTVIASSGALTGLDGLAFDPLTGNLFAGSRTINSVSGREGFYELSLQSSSFLDATLITSSSFPTTFDPDGLETDGQGNLYLASEALRGDNKIYQYNMATGTLAALTAALPGLDDLAPLVGQGAPTPEPSTLSLAATGFLACLGYACLRSRTGKRGRC
jgi:hypothetical protein